MGDLAVGARSGHEGPEERRERPDRERPDSEPSPVEDAVTSPGDSDDGAGGGIPGSDADEQPPAPQSPKKKQRSFWKELPILIGIALVLALLIKTFLVQAFSIPSDSMQNTLQQGDRVLVDKLTPWFGSEPERGEVVVFNDPDNWLAGEPEHRAGRLIQPANGLLS